MLCNILCLFDVILYSVAVHLTIFFCHFVLLCCKCMPSLAILHHFMDNYGNSASFLRQFFVNFGCLCSHLESLCAHILLLEWFGCYFMYLVFLSVCIAILPCYIIIFFSSYGNFLSLCADISYLFVVILYLFMVIFWLLLIV